MRDPLHHEQSEHYMALRGPAAQEYSAREEEFWALKHGSFSISASNNPHLGFSHQPTTPA